MPEEDTPEYTKHFRLTLEFEASVSTEILQAYSDEDELSAKEKRQLRAQRNLLKALLESKQYLLDELIRKRVLEEAEFEMDREEVKDMARVRNLAEEDLLEPAIDLLSVEDQRYYQQAVEQKRFGKDAEDVVNAICVDLVSAYLQEIDASEVDSDD